MIHRLLLTLLVASLALSTGCSLFRKGDRKKESSAIAAEVEATFRRRWIEKRTAEIVAQGVAAEAARVQAENEFRERFAFAREPQP